MILPLRRKRLIRQ